MGLGKRNLIILILRLIILIYGSSLVWVSWLRG
jgi:hypothetical protein